MVRGRKPKPTVQKKLAGNPGKRKLNKSEPVPPPGVPSCPTHLPEDVKKVWFEVTAHLVAMKLLTMPDAVTCEVLCQAIARYRRATVRMAEEGEVIKRGKMVFKSPWLSVIKDAESVINIYGSKFGLSPADRSRITVPEDDKKADPLEELLKRGRKNSA